MSIIEASAPASGRIEQPRARDSVPAAALRVLFAGGGTGGHLLPGVEVAREIARMSPGARLIFAGSGKAIEAKILDGSGFERETLPAAKSPRRVRDVPRFSWELAKALRAGWRRVREIAPDLVIGLGGYASAAPALAAAAMGRPVFLLEQNARPGRANRLLARVAREVYVPWESVRGHFSTRARVEALGNPVRRHVLEVVPARDARVRLGLDPSLATLLVVGGSQGARGVNRAVEAALPLLAAERARLQVIHLAGDDDAPQLQAAYGLAGVRAHVLPFLGAMEVAYSAADVVLARAGGTTIAELLCRRLPAVLVPFPAAAEDHQTANAREVERTGGALLVPEALLAGEGMAMTLALLFDRPRREEMAARMASSGKPDAARTIARRMLDACGRA